MVLSSENGFKIFYSFPEQFVTGFLVIDSRQDLIYYNTRRQGGLYLLAFGQLQTLSRKIPV